MGFLKIIKNLKEKILCISIFFEISDELTQLQKKIKDFFMEDVASKKINWLKNIPQNFSGLS